VRARCYCLGGGLAFADDPVVVKVLYFAPAEGENVSFENSIESMGDEETAYSITRVTSPFLFGKSLDTSTWDMVVAADVVLCETTSQCDKIDDYVLGGNSIFTVTTPGPEEDGISEITRIEPEIEYDATGLGTVVGIETNVVSPVHAASLVPIACFIEWIECRDWCNRNTPFLSQERRNCDKACNEALADCLALAD